MNTAKTALGIELGSTQIKSLTGHGGLFKTPGVGQRYLSAVCNTPVTCMETAGEGGPYGIALLVAYRIWKSDGETLEDYLQNRLFAGTPGTTLAPEQADVVGFNTFIEKYRALLQVERAAVEIL